MKLISINVEGQKHFSRVTTFLESENADVICLQEVQPDLELFLRSQGYAVAFLPMTLRQEENGNIEEGILIATKHPATFDFFYYHEPKTSLRIYDKTDWYETCAQGVVYAEIQYEGIPYTIGTTHFTWTPDGQVAGHEQIADMVSFIKKIGQLSPHVICGDFNIPRHHNYLYEALDAKYTDEIPAHYKSSLDRELHRLGTNKDKAIIFEEYMVDYIFTENPYKAKDVRLEFGVSDHAAIVGTIFQ